MTSLSNRGNRILIETHLSYLNKLQIYVNRYAIYDLLNIMNTIRYDLTNMIHCLGIEQPIERQCDTVPELTAWSTSYFVRSFARTIEEGFDLSPYERPFTELNDPVEYLYIPPASQNNATQNSEVERSEVERREVERFSSEFNRMNRMIETQLLPEFILDTNQALEDATGSDDSTATEIDEFADLPDLIEADSIDPRTESLFNNNVMFYNMFYNNQQIFFDSFKPAIIMPKIKSKVLNKTRLNSPTLNDCGICLENHIKRDTTILSLCCHEFGQECFQGWMDIRKKNKQPINCPTCRSEVKEMKYFRERAKNKKI